MSRRPRFRLIPTTCRRCGAAIWTGNHSLYGTDDLKARYGSICEECLSLEEHQQMRLEMGQRIAARGQMEGGTC